MQVQVATGVEWETGMTSECTAPAGEWNYMIGKSINGKSHRLYLSHKWT